MSLWTPGRRLRHRWRRSFNQLCIARHGRNSDQFSTRSLLAAKKGVSPGSKPAANQQQTRMRNRGIVSALVRCQRHIDRQSSCSPQWKFKVISYAAETLVCSERRHLFQRTVACVVQQHEMLAHARGWGRALPITGSASAPVHGGSSHVTMPTNSKGRRFKSLIDAASRLPRVAQVATVPAATRARATSRARPRPHAQPPLCPAHCTLIW